MIPLFFKDFAEFVLDERVHGTITINVKGKEWIACLEEMLRQVHAVYRIDSEWRYVIVPDKGDGQKPVFTSAKFNKTPIRKAVATLFPDLRNFIFDTAVEGSVTGDFYQMPPEVCLKMILEQIGARFEISVNDIYVIRALPSYQDDRADPRGKPISATFTDADVRNVFLTFFRTCNASFVLDPRVHCRVTAEFKSVAALDIVDEVAHRAHAVTHEQNGIIYIMADEKHPPQKEDRREVGAYVFNFSNRPLKDGLRALFDVAGTNAASLQVHASGIASVSGQFDSFSDAVQAVVDQTHSMLCISQGRYVVEPSGDFHGWPDFGTTISLDAGQDREPDLYSTKVTLSFKNTSLRDAIQMLFAGRGSAVVSPEIDGVLTKSFIDERFENVLRAICMSGDATYRITDHVYEIVPKEALVQGFPSGPTTDTSIAIQFTKLPLKTAIFEIMRFFHAEVWIDPDFKGTITAEQRFRTKEEAACWLCEQINAEIVIADNKFLVRSKSKGKFPVYNFDKKDLRDAIRAVCNDAHVNYSIAPEVQGIVTGHFQGSFESVLRDLLRYGNAHWIMESGVYMIVRNSMPGKGT